MVNQLLFGDCLELMRDIPNATVDMICCDLPYGVTARNEWDKVIDLPKLWEQYHRITKPNAAILLFASQPFTTQLISSNLKDFRYDLVWEKNKSTGFLNAKVMPMRIHETVLVFYKSKPTYNPQKSQGHKPMNAATRRIQSTNYGLDTKPEIPNEAGTTERYPTSVLKFPVLNNDDPERFHPTQKPLELLEFLIKSYTNEGEIVLDNCAGAASTCMAAINTKRNYIGIEANKEYFDKALARIKSHESK